LAVHGNVEFKYVQITIFWKIIDSNIQMLLTIVHHSKITQNHINIDVIINQNHPLTFISCNMDFILKIHVQILMEVN
jgi:hypothetical protein